MLEKSPTLKYYRDHLSSHRTQIVIPSILACGVFLAPTFLKYDYLPLWSCISIVVPLIFMTTGHGYILKKLANEESKKHNEEIEEYKKKLNGTEEEYEKKLNIIMENTETAEKEKNITAHNYNLLRHLIEVTNRLVNFKRAELAKKDLSPKQRFDLCLNLNLSMLCEFYEIHSREIEIRLVFFVPVPNNTHLIPYVWYNHKQESPKSMGQPAKNLELFGYDSPRKVCEAWRTRKIVIIENTGTEPFEFNHPLQTQYLKSLLAYPILNPEDSSVTGVISIIASRPGFFKKDEEEYHRFIIEHFATRVNYENSEYKRSSIWRRQ